MNQRLIDQVKANLILAHDADDRDARQSLLRVA